MTSTRRTRKSNTKRTIKQVDTVIESSDEASSDSGSVTRCVCGEAHNLGLMVQCDKCEVWQHCECIGLIQEKLPDHYYCDQCKPGQHKVTKPFHGRSTRLFNYVNNRESSVTPCSLDNSAPSAPSDPSSSLSPPQPTTTKRSRNTSSARLQSNSSLSLKEITPVIVLETQPKTIETKVEETTFTTLAITQTQPRRNSSSSSTSNIHHNGKKVIGNEESPLQKKKSVFSNKRAISSSPSTHEKKLKSAHNNTKSNNSLSLLADLHSSSTLPYWNYSNGRLNRESSPPAKIKYPGSKMSFSDMNKRAKQIMECICKLQEEMPINTSTAVVVTAAKEDVLLFNTTINNGSRQRSSSTSSDTSSVSSASTVPLIDDYYSNSSNSSGSSPSTPAPFVSKEEESAIDILERINRELNKFERKFGVF